IAALTRAYRGWTQERGFCAVGSVKTNVGHLDTAAGVTGLIKTVLALEHRLIPPSLNFHTPNPEIDFESSPFYVNTTLREWAHSHRRVLIGGSREQAIKALQSRSSSAALTAVEDSLTSPVAFLFPGQGSQFANMGSELYGEEPVFRSYVDVASDILKNTLARDL